MVYVATNSLLLLPWHRRVVSVMVGAMIFLDFWWRGAQSEAVSKNEGMSRTLSANHAESAYISHP